MSNIDVNLVLFGTWVRNQRRTSGLTQEALADKALLSVKTIKKIESKSPTGQLHESTALKIAEALGHKLPDVLQTIERSLERSSGVQHKTGKMAPPEIRVAFSALLRIADADRFVLVRNLHRKETFGPFGGVFKYLNEAQSTLDNCEFKPQVIEPRDDMRNDLRGFLPQQHLKNILAWYRKGFGRESSEQCLIRELKEELKEAGLSGNLNCPTDIEFRQVRSVAEGPASVPGQLYKQYRIFEVLDPITGNRETDEFLRRLFEMAHQHSNLLIARSQEIYAGRSKSGVVIGPQSGYLLGKKRIRPDDPLFPTA
jgi:transcriptional regulator with XRE-family HTH domain